MTHDSSSFTKMIAVAPMLDWTDRHCRYFLRLLSTHAVLYTEMMTVGALLHGDAHRFLQFDSTEHPLALQLGGSDPDELARCATLAASFGYDEINLNVGCPSDRVQSGRFGACLMAEPQLVGECVKAMREAVDIPVTVKTRIGIDERDSYEALVEFIETVAKQGCMHFIIHARKAWLKGLSPKENRDIPPLHYETVYRLKKDFPDLHFTINGGIKTLADIKEHFSHDIDGVMLGRQAYHEPYLLAEIEHQFYGTPLPDRKAVIERFLPYVEKQLSQSIPLHAMTRHILGLFHGVPGARSWRRYLTEQAHRRPYDVKVMLEALRSCI